MYIIKGLLIAMSDVKVNHNHYCKKCKLDFLLFETAVPSTYHNRAYNCERKSIIFLSKKASSPLSGPIRHFFLNLRHMSHLLM